MQTEPPRLARVRGIPLLRTMKLRCLSPCNAQLVVRKCELLSEGQTVRENGSSSFFGSTMITLRAERIGGRLSDRDLDELLRHIRHSPVVNLHLTRLARLEAARRIGPAAPGTAYYTFSARRSGRSIQITIDVEIPHIEGACRTSGT